MDNSENNSKDRVGKFTHAIDRSDLQPGDHIYVYNSWLMYSHHGIYTGDDRVIHLSGGEQSKKAAAQVRECTLDEFLNGNQLRLATYGVKRITRRIKKSGTCHILGSRSVQDVLYTAEYYLQNPDKWGRYNVLTNNCEHFAYCCKTSNKRSSQVDGYLRPSRSLLLC